MTAAELEHLAIRLAQSLVHLDDTRDQWHAEMRRHRERLLASA